MTVQEPYSRIMPHRTQVLLVLLVQLKRHSITKFSMRTNAKNRIDLRWFVIHSLGTETNLTADHVRWDLRSSTS